MDGSDDDGGNATPAKKSCKRPTPPKAEAEFAAGGIFGGGRQLPTTSTAATAAATTAQFGVSASGFTAGPGGAGAFGAAAPWPTTPVFAAGPPHSAAGADAGADPFSPPAVAVGGTVGPGQFGDSAGLCATSNTGDARFAAVASNHDDMPANIMGKVLARYSPGSAAAVAQQWASSTPSDREKLVALLGDGSIATDAFSPSGSAQKKNKKKRSVSEILKGPIQTPMDREVDAMIRLASKNKTNPHFLWDRFKQSLDESHPDKNTSFKEFKKRFYKGPLNCRDTSAFRMSRGWNYADARKGRSSMDEPADLAAAPMVMNVGDARELYGKLVASEKKAAQDVEIRELAGRKVAEELEEMEQKKGGNHQLLPSADDDLSLQFSKHSLGGNDSIRDAYTAAGHALSNVGQSPWSPVPGQLLSPSDSAAIAQSASRLQASRSHLADVRAQNMTMRLDQMRQQKEAELQNAADLSTTKRSIIAEEAERKRNAATSTYHAAAHTEDKMNRAAEDEAAKKLLAAEEEAERRATAFQAETGGVNGALQEMALAANQEYRKTEETERGIVGALLDRPSSNMGTVATNLHGRLVNFPKDSGASVSVLGGDETDDGANPYGADPLADLMKSIVGKGGGDDDEKTKLRAALAGAIVTEKPDVKWDDVAGLEGAKDSLKESVILPVRFPQLFTGKRRPFKGILLYGPPGTGKSYLAKAVATESDATFFSVSSADLISKWQGESERLVRNLFEMARESDGGRAIIFIDEVDSLCGSRSEGENESARRIKTEFLVQMDGVGTGQGDVLVLGATNVPWELDAAIRRRFEKRVYIPLPEREARAFMVKLNVGDTPNNLTDEDYETLGEITEGASGSDIKVVVKEALMEPLRRCQKAEQFRPDEEGNLVPCENHPSCPRCPPKLSSDPPGKDYTCRSCGAQRLAIWDIPPEKLRAPEVKVKDFQQVLKHSFSSVSKDELTQHDDWTTQFGQEGT